MSATLEQAYRLLHRGYAPIDVPYRSKKPSDREGWQNERWTAEELPLRFNGVPKNIGVLVGTPSGGRVDVDLDATEVLALADLVLPPTDARFGRPSKPNSHRIYLADPCPEAVERFKDVDTKRTTLVELRSDGGQTIFPGSVHPSGEPIEWVLDGEPSVIDGRILRAQVAKLAAAALIARHWPPPPARDESGTRHDLALALAGVLLRAEWTEDDAREFIVAVARVGGDEEAAARGANVRTTARRLAGTESKKVTGWPTFARLIGQNVADKVRDWLNVDWPDFSTDDLPAAGMGRRASGPTSECEFFPPPDEDDRGGQSPEPDEAESGGRQRSTIRVSGRDPKDVAEDAIRVIQAANDPEPRLFVRGGGLVRTRTTELGRPIVDALDRDGLFHTLLSLAQWGRFDKRAKTWGPASPPDDVVRYISGHRALPFPPLAGITEAPIVRPDGTIITVAGYDPITHLIYRPAPGLVVPSIPDTPSSADVAAAVSLLGELLIDFAFAEDGGDSMPSASRANAYALLLTLALRSAIEGATPMAAINKNSPGAGATLLIEVFGMVAHGRAPGLTALPEDDGELEKRITTLLRDGDPINVFDNVDRPLEHGSLALVLTATEWAGRVLGKSETARYPNRAVWVANGVNLSLRGDIARRSYEIRIVVDDAQPWRLEGGERRFRHPRLMEWAEQQRGTILGACLTLARNWYANGQPAPSTPTLGKFEDWCRVIGGILESAGIRGFLGNLDSLYHNVDAESPEWTAFLTAWFERYGPAEMTAKRIEGDLKGADGGALLDALPGELASSLTDPRSSFSHRLGQALAKRVERRYGERKLRIVRGGNAARGKWRVDVGFVGFVGFSTTNAGENAGSVFSTEGGDENPTNPTKPTPDPDVDLCSKCGVNPVELFGLDCEECMGVAS
jgi:hypothetical protein